MGAMVAARPEQSAGMLSGPSLLVVATLTAATTALGGFLAAGQRLVAALLFALTYQATQPQPTTAIRTPAGPPASNHAPATCRDPVAGAVDQ
jgi:hypothetical protein